MRRRPQTVRGHRLLRLVAAPTAFDCSWGALQGAQLLGRPGGRRPTKHPPARLVTLGELRRLRNRMTTYWAQLPGRVMSAARELTHRAETFGSIGWKDPQRSA